MSNVKLVIFDCDGVIVQTESANRAYYNHLRQRFHHPPIDQEEIKYVQAHHVIESIRHIFRDWPEDVEDVFEYRSGLSYTHFVKFMTMAEDLMEFLEYLQSRIQIAISTNRNRDTIDLIMEAFNLKQHFEYIVTPQDVKNPKPHPEALHKILSHYNRSPHEAIYIGDSDIDSRHAAGAKIPFVAFRNRQLTADAYIDNFMELLGERWGI